MDNIYFNEEIDLSKAQRDTSKLVQVQRSVTRRGKTFMQNFWVNPADVKKTDIVIGNAHNLIPNMSTIPKPAKGVWDATYFDALNKQKDKTPVVDYLKECGVTWTESPNPGINLMRALMSATRQGLIAPKAKKATTSTTPTPTPPSTASTSTPVAPSTNNSALAPYETDLKALANGKAMVKHLKDKLGADGTIALAKTLGVTWDEHSHSGINQMRMSMALAKYLEANIQGTGNVGAPIGNQNAKKNDTTPPAPPTPPPDVNKIEVPNGASQRKKNIAEFINKLTDITEISSLASVGMVPEDDVAKAYILDKLVPKYKTWYQKKFGNTPNSTGGNSNTTVVSNSVSNFGTKLCVDFNVNGCKRDVVGKGFQTLYTDFSMAILTNPNEMVRPAWGTRGNSKFGMENNGEVITRLNENFSDYTTDDYTYYYLDWSDNLTEQTEHTTNRGYIGCSSNEYRKRFDLEKEGFVRYLRQIQQKDSSSEMKESVEKAIGKYEALMKKVSYNPHILKKILSSTEWDTDTSTADVWNIDTRACNSYNPYDSDEPKELLETVKTLDKHYNLIVSELRKIGLTDEDIYYTMDRGWRNDSFEAFQPYDKDGNKIGAPIDFLSMKDANGDFILDRNKRYNRCVPYQTQLYIKSKIIIDGEWYKHPSDYFKKVIPQRDLHRNSNGDVVEYEPSTIYTLSEAWRELANYTESDFMEIHAMALDLFGTQVSVDSNNGTIVFDKNTSPASLGYFSDVYRANPVKIETASGVTQSDKNLMSNILMTNLTLKMNERVSGNASDNASVALNDYGDDYSKNFSFYSGHLLGGQNYARLKQSGNSSVQPSALYTKDEVSEKVAQQMSKMPYYSSEYLEAVEGYYSAQASTSGKSTIDTASEVNFSTVSHTVDLDNFINSPLKDVLYTQSTQLFSYVPNMVKTGEDKMATRVAKKMDYVPFDFSASVQPRLKKTKNNTPAPAVNTPLKQAREELFKVANCTIAVESEDVSLAMRKEFMRKWDYDPKHPETTPDGIKVYSKRFDGTGPTSQDRRALFNTRFFKINNSNMQEDYASYAPTTSDNKEIEVYHACPYSAVAGIFGVSGGWIGAGKGALSASSQRKVSTSGMMLGAGAYFGWKGGKSWVYCGENSYSMNHSSIPNDDANGCYVLCKVVKGNSGDSTTDRGSVNDWEICVHNNSCISPHHFVDISARALNINVTRDSQGNYLDRNGKITHDKYGKAIDMK